MVKKKCKKKRASLSLLHKWLMVTRDMDKARFVQYIHVFYQEDITFWFYLCKLWALCYDRIFCVDAVFSLKKSRAYFFTCKKVA